MVMGVKLSMPKTKMRTRPRAKLRSRSRRRVEERALGGQGVRDEEIEAERRQRRPADDLRRGEPAGALAAVEHQLQAGERRGEHEEAGPVQAHRLRRLAVADEQPAARRAPPRRTAPSCRTPRASRRPRRARRRAPGRPPGRAPKPRRRSRSPRRGARADSSPARSPATSARAARRRRPAPCARTPGSRSSPRGRTPPRRRRRRATQARHRRRSPKRTASQPVSGVITAVATRLEVITQASWSGVAESAPWICGSDTFTAVRLIE